MNYGGDFYNDGPTRGATLTGYGDYESANRQEALNFEGNPTQYYDDSGLRAIRTSRGVFDVNSFNPILKEGEQINANTPSQATDDDGNLLFLEQNGERTTRNTGIPAVYGTVSDSAYMNPIKNGGVFGGIGSDFREAVKDPTFKNFLLSAGAMAGAAAFAPALGGAGAAGAEAFPIAMGDSITMSPLAGGAAAPAYASQGAGLGALGSEAGLGAGEFVAADAAAPGYAASTGGAGLVDTGAAMAAPGTSAMVNGGTGVLGTGLTGAEMLKYGLGAVTAAGALGTLAGGNKGSGGSGGGGGGSSQPGNIRPYTFNRVKNPNYAGAGTPYFLQSYQAGTPYAAANGGAVGMANGGIAALAGGGTLPLGQNNMYPMSSMGRDGAASTGQYATPTQEPVSSEVVNAGYETKTNPYMGTEVFNMASGGIANLGGYSDGGQLLRGPGDGVSDDIPAQIGEKQPARLADGEFVIPARIVSELGNGSTDAGAKRLYAMMERVQASRNKTVGKGKVAVDSKTYRHLPA